MSNFLNTISPFNLVLNVVGMIYRKKNIALYGEGGGELLSTASIISCSVNDSSKLMEHPIESGAVIADYKVFNPVTASVVVALSATGYESEFAEIYTSYKNCEYITLQTKTQVYSNLQILSLPHEATFKNISRPTITINLKEALVVEAEFTQGSNLKNPANTNTKDLGHVQTKKVKRPSTILNDIAGKGKKQG